MFQLWTMYCESIAAMYNSTSENYVAASSTVMDFWARVTPGILQLLSHSKVVSEGWVPVQDGGSLSVRNSYWGVGFWSKMVGDAVFEIHTGGLDFGVR